MENIILDGGYLEGKNTADYGGFFKSRCPGYELTLNSGAVLRNTNITGAYHGGAIDLDEGTLTINDGAIIENFNAAADDAGAIHTHAGVTITMNGGTISNCSAGRHGGAICIEGVNCIFNMKGGTIENCSAGTDGGAIQVFRDATFNMSGGTITGCSCNGTNGTYGGAIAMAQKGTIIITGGTIAKCTAKQSGGAIYLGDGTFSMENAMLSENKSENGSGGLIYITKVSSAVNIKECTIEKCTAPNGTGGVFMIKGTGITLSVDNTTFSQDKAKIGGIVHLQADSTITINNSTIDSCEATVVDGGAIKLESGTININNSEIKNCKAKTIGGAVWAGGGKLTLDNSIVDNCSAVTGGGVYLASGSNVYIEGTTAVTNCTGSGLYLAQSTTTQLHFSGSPQVTNNDINVNMTQITTTQDSQFTNIVSAERIEAGSNIGLNIINTKYNKPGDVFGKTDLSSATYVLTGFKNDVNTPLVGWPVTYGQAGQSYWVIPINVQAKYLDRGVESDVTGSLGLYAPNKGSSSYLSLDDIRSQYSNMNAAFKAANSNPAYTFAYAMLGDTKIEYGGLNYVQNTGVWSYNGTTLSGDATLTVYYYKNPVDVTVHYIQKLGNTYTETSSKTVSVPAYYTGIPTPDSPAAGAYTPLYTSYGANVTEANANYGSTGTTISWLQNAADGVHMNEATGTNILAAAEDLYYVYYLNTVSLNVKWVEQQTDGTLIALAGKSDQSFDVPNSDWKGAADLFRSLVGSETAPVVIGKCYYQYLGLGGNSVTAYNSLAYKGIEDFALKNSKDGLLYKSSKTAAGDGTVEADINTVYIIYSKTPPAGSTFFDIINNTEMPYTLWNIYVGDASSHMHVDKAVWIKTAAGDLELLTTSGTNVAPGETMHLVLLDAANDAFDLNGGLQGTPMPDVINVSVSNPNRTFKLTGDARYNTYNYVTGQLLGYGEKVTVVFGAEITGHDLTVSKIVTGAMGDPSREFTIYLSSEALNAGETYSDAAATPNTYTVDAQNRITLTLKHGQSITLKELPEGDYTVTEENTVFNYAVTYRYKVGASGTETTGQTFTLDDDATVTITNRLDTIAPTGVSLRTDSYVFLLLGGVLLVAGLWFSRRKRREDETP